MLEAIDKAGFKAGTDVYVALDVAASEFFDETANSTSSRSPATRRARSDEMIALYDEWSREYPIISIEDGLAEADWPGWKTLTKALGEKVQLVGDDVFVTNPAILKEGIAKGIGNSLLVKVNQIGTVSETLDAMAMAWAAGYATIASHRSGETEDSTIADLAVGTQRRPDQDRLALPQRSRRQVQPAAPHRGSARRRAPSTRGRAAIKQLK